MLSVNVDKTQIMLETATETINDTNRLQPYAKSRHLLKLDELLSFLPHFRETLSFKNSSNSRLLKLPVDFYV